MASTNITTSVGRARLKPRPSPYFAKIAKRQHLGYRRLAAGGSWIARYTAGKDKTYRHLGSEADFAEYKDVLTAAMTWFREAAAEDRPDSGYTVGQAITDYLADLRIRKSEDASRRTKQVAAKHIVLVLGKIEITRLSSKRIKAWRDNLIKDSDEPDVVRRSKDTANRILAILKAALNLAFKDGVTRSDEAWRRIRPFPRVGRAREVFLTIPQCTALLNACEPDFRSLVRSALLTGTRYGELVRRRVGEFDRTQCILHIPDGKTGVRDVILSDTAVAHFRELSKGKLPGALLHARDERDEWGKSEQSRRIKTAVTVANKTIKKQAEKIPESTVFYSLRHTHVSLALLGGVNIQVLAENLGTSIRMIEMHYGKFLRSDRRAMFNAVVLP